MHEPILRRWRRRLITLPGVFLAFALTLAALPALLVLALLVDLALRRRSLSTVRLALLLPSYLGTEVTGLLLLGGVWLASLGSPARRAALTWPVQRLYTAMHFVALRTLFSLRFEVEGDALGAQGGPLLVLVRHVSVADVLLPGYFLAGRHRLHLRYVLKRELLVDPCLDVAGHWIPNHFVARDGTETDREILAVAALKAGLGPGEGVLIYPEGTRFTEAKRRRLLQRLASDPEALARTERLRHLLPIRAGGSLALLEAAPACDVLILGHAGLEGLTSLADIWAGALVRRTIRLKLRRIAGADVPEGRAARLAWLDAEWQRLDDWLESVVARGADHA
jgi:1-acyl-sn-glycerol-3-phosphate acyltransferase